MFETAPETPAPAPSKPLLHVRKRPSAPSVTGLVEDWDGRG